MEYAVLDGGKGIDQAVYSHALSGVTVDLNGFDLVGVPGSLDGVADRSSSSGSVLSILP